ncbi:MAG: c-type cytochrome [Nannocystaceae bacterium]
MAAKVGLSAHQRKKSLLRVAAAVTGLAGLLLTGACDQGPPEFTGPQVLGGKSVSAERLNHGRKLYLRSCASCHGYEGKGDGPAARSLDPKPRNFQNADFLYTSTPKGELPTDDDLVAIISQGKLDRGMPSWRGLQVDDIQALADYIKTFSPRWRASKAASEAAPVAPPVDPG